MQLWLIPIRADTVRILWAHCRDVRRFDVDSEIWLLRLDMLISFKRWGGDHQRVAEYLLPGREDWGL